MQINRMQHWITAVARHQGIDAEHFKCGFVRRFFRVGRRACLCIVQQGLTQIGLAHRRIRLHLGRCTQSQPLPCVQHHDVVRYIHHQRHVMLNQQHGDARVCNAPQQRCQAGLVLARQACGGLVEQQRVRVKRQGSGNLHQTAINMRQIGSGLIKAALVAAVVEQCMGTLACTRRTQMGRAQQPTQFTPAHRQQHVVSNAQRIEKQ